MAEPMSDMREAARMVHAHEDSMIKMEFEFLNRRDDDLSVKSGAVLGFAGLLIAATLVLLAAEPQTALHADADSPGSLATAGGLAALFVGAVLALLAVSMTRGYDAGHAEALLARLDRRVKARQSMWRWSCALIFLGSVAVGVAYALVLAQNAFGLRV